MIGHYLQIDLGTSQLNRDTLILSNGGMMIKTKSRDLINYLDRLQHASRMIPGGQRLWMSLQHLNRAQSHSVMCHGPMLDIWARSEMHETNHMLSFTHRV